MNRGLIHLYTGEGKGKTTAALGLLLRANGCGMRTVLAQFLKGRETGEIKALESLKNVVVMRHTQELGFLSSANEQTIEEIISQNNANLTKVFRLIDDGLCDMLVLDEICAAYTNSALDTEMVDRLIMEKPFSLELVLTGRNAPQHFIENADYVTEFVKHKHPYDDGISARKGIEY